MLVTGIIIGFVTKGFYSTVNHTSEATSITQSINLHKANPYSSITAPQDHSDQESEIRILREEITMLEEELAAQRQTIHVELPKASQKTQLTNQQIKQVLLKIGITDGIAEDILNRLSQHEYQLLALHDQAKREGYDKTPRYYKERRELIKSAPSLQNAIGNTAFDQYLYQTEQNNRVRVIGVMQNSPAMQLGVQTGDIILSYANEPVLSWRELRKLTEQGLAGEYVNLNILRNEQLLNILVPRGPIGVRLEATRLDPLKKYNY